MARPRNKRPVSVKVYQGSHDQLWHGYITVGTKPNGKPDVRHRTGRTRDECEDKIRQLEDEVAAKKVAPAGRAPTLERYLTDWLAGLDLRYKTVEDYTRVVTTQLIPHLGGHRLADDGLTADNVKAMMKAVERELSTSAANRAHRVLRTALSQAVREERLTRNVARLVQPFREEETEVEPLTMDEVRAVLAQIYQLPRNRSRWLLALVFGMRQGECLGLAWARADQPRLPGDVDLQGGTLTVREKLLRKKWQHGCDDPARCARWRHGCPIRTACRKDECTDGKPCRLGDCWRPRPCGLDAWLCPKRTVRCRTKPCRVQWRHGCATVDDRPGCGKKLAYVCPQRTRERACERHRGPAGCPRLCSEGCTGHARTCPQRRGGGLVKEPPKSRAGNRTLVLPPPLIDAIRWDRDQQEEDREQAGELWADSGLVYTTEVGRPLDPRRDWQLWHDILAAAGVAPARLHDARHTAATFLLLMGVDKRTVMDLMGWSQESMLKRYQHVIDELRKDAAVRMERLWWPAPEPPAGGGSDAGSSTDHATGDDQGRRRGHLRGLPPAV